MVNGYIEDWSVVSGGRLKGDRQLLLSCVYLLVASLHVGTKNT